jgi:hypothetical protein
MGNVCCCCCPGVAGSGGFGGYSIAAAEERRMVQLEEWSKRDAAKSKEMRAAMPHARAAAGYRGELIAC